MPAYYLDASALAKRFVSERGSKWLHCLLEQEEQATFISNELVVVEVISAISRAHQEKRIGSNRRDSIIVQLHDEAAHLIHTVPVSGAIVRSAGTLTVTYGLRAYDAVHLATALDIAVDVTGLGLGPPVFISADSTLLKAARAEGLATDNPNDHA